MVDLAYKPGRARQPSSPQARLQPPAAKKAWGSDEKLLAFIDQQAQEAAQAFFAGGATDWSSHTKKAIKILRRAFEAADQHAGPVPGLIPPVAHLAKAVLRLTRTMMLSRLSDHGQAVDEARAAVRDTDVMWQTMASEAGEAASVGDFQHPATVLKWLLRSPDQWLERAVEVSVQARQCLAVELEFQSKPANAGLASDEDLASGRARAGEPRQQTCVAIKRWNKANRSLDTVLLQDDVALERHSDVEEDKTAEEEIERLYREVMTFAAMLPTGHSVRRRADQAQDERNSRMTTQVASSPSPPLPPPPRTLPAAPPSEYRSPLKARAASLIENASPVVSSSQSVLPSVGRSSAMPSVLQTRGGRDSSAGSSASGPDQDKAPGSATSSENDSPPVSATAAVASSHRRSARRSVRTRSEKRQSIFFTTESPECSVRRRSRSDLFQEWRDKHMDVDDMSMKQVRTYLLKQEVDSAPIKGDKGLMHENVKRMRSRSSMVKMEMKEYDDDKILVLRKNLALKGAQKEHGNGATAKRGSIATAKRGSLATAKRGSSSLPDLVSSLAKQMKESMAEEIKAEQERQQAEAVERLRRKAEAEKAREAALKAHFANFARPSRIDKSIAVDIANQLTREQAVEQPALLRHFSQRANLS